MSWSEMCTWNDDTPAIVPAGARISAGKFGQRREVVAEGGADVGEAVAGELHAVAGVAGEADDDLVERLGLERRGIWGHAASFPGGGRWVADRARGATGVWSRSSSYGAPRPIPGPRTRSRALPRSPVPRTGHRDGDRSGEGVERARRALPRAARADPGGAGHA